MWGAQGQGRVDLYATLPVDIPGFEVLQPTVKKRDADVDADGNGKDGNADGNVGAGRGTKWGQSVSATTLRPTLTAGILTLIHMQMPLVGKSTAIKTGTQATKRTPKQLAQEQAARERGYFIDEDGRNSPGDIVLDIPEPEEEHLRGLPKYEPPAHPKQNNQATAALRYADYDTIPSEGVQITADMPHYGPLLPLAPFPPLPVQRVLDVEEEREYIHHEPAPFPLIKPHPQTMAAYDSLHNELTRLRNHSQAILQTHFRHPALAENDIDPMLKGYHQREKCEYRTCREIIRGEALESAAEEILGLLKRAEMVFDIGKEVKWVEGREGVERVEWWPYGPKDSPVAGEIVDWSGKGEF